MTSVVVIVVVAPFQFVPALMPNRLYEVLPSALRISPLPQPDSCAACATMNAAGMPLCASAARAAAACLLMKSAWVGVGFAAPAPDAPGAPAAEAGAIAAELFAALVPLICRSS